MNKSQYCVLCKFSPRFGLVLNAKVRNRQCIRWK